MKTVGFVGYPIPWLSAMRTASRSLSSPFLHVPPLAPGDYRPATRFGQAPFFPGIFRLRIDVGCRLFLFWHGHANVRVLCQSLVKHTDKHARFARSLIRVHTCKTVGTRSRVSPRVSQRQSVLSRFAFAFAIFWRASGLSTLCVRCHEMELKMFGRILQLCRPEK